VKRAKGADAFEAFYSQIYGDRWESLKSALLQPKKHYAYSHFNKDYHLDFASTLPIEALNIQNTDKVVDLCSAPGGKSLMIMGKEPASLICNDLSNDRLQRVKKVMREYLPENLQEKVSFTKRDATLWSQFEKEEYDKVLLDAPCSSERHFLEKESELQHWSEGRTKRLAKLQWSLLASAIDITKPGGLLVYSTCSISPLENDEVIRKALKKREGKLSLKIFPQILVKPRNLADLSYLIKDSGDHFTLLS
jgi:16S rRNA C967 or C1407 C5-methylase (RsmB/RsmF family)